MKLTVSKGELATKISMVSRVVPAKAVKPVLQGILFKVSDGRLTISATDLETGFVTEVREFNADEDGAFVVEGKVVDEVVRNMPGDQVHIEYDGISAIFSSQKSRFTLPTMNPKEFPEFSPDVTGEEITLSTTQVETMLERTMFSAAKEEIMRNLNGVLWEFDSDYLRFVAADGFRLALAETTNDSGFLGTFLLSLNSMKDFLSSIKSASSDELIVRTDGRRVGFTFDGTQMVVRVVDAEFPNYKTVLPKDFRTRVVMNNDLFIEVLKRVSIAAKLGSETVKLEIRDEVMRVSARSSDRGEAVEEVEVDVKDGEDLIIGFNPKFLLEACQHIDTESVELNFKDSNSPVQINPVDVEGYLYIVMPVRLI